MEKKKDWFDKHVIVKTLNDDKDAEKKIKEEIKKVYEGKKWNARYVINQSSDMGIMLNL